MLTQRRNYAPLGADKQAHRRTKVIKSQLRGRSTLEPRYRLIKRALGGSVVLLMWPRSAACHQPALSVLGFSFYQQLLGRHSAAVANESSDLLPAFSHPLSQPGSPFWLSLSSLSFSLPLPLSVYLHGIFFHILSYLPLPPCLCLCSSPASFFYTTFRHSLPLSSTLCFFFFLPPTRHPRG